MNFDFSIMKKLWDVGHEKWRTRVNNITNVSLERKKYLNLSSEIISSHCDSWPVCLTLYNHSHTCMHVLRVFKCIDFYSFLSCSPHGSTNFPSRIPHCHMLINQLFFWPKKQQKQTLKKDLFCLVKIIVKIRNSRLGIYSRGFLQRQLWMVNYYVKCLSNNLSNENINTGVSREMIFQK